MRPLRFKIFSPPSNFPGFGAGEPTRLHEWLEFGPNPGALRMFSYVPEGLSESAPLVVVLHGCTQDAASYDTGAGWSALADRFGFAVLAPQQQQANNMRGCFNWFLPEDTTRNCGEAASIRQMIQVMVDDHDIDTRRIFITGLSAGGAMTSVMLAAYPEVFNAGAILAGLPYGAAANVQEALACMHRVPGHSEKEWGDKVRNTFQYDGRRPRVSVWHGDADHTVHPSNAEAILMQWRNVLGLHTQPTQVGLVNGHPYRSWQNDAEAKVLESYTIHGLAHGTPILSGDSDEACGTPGGFILESNISSTFRIAEFWGLAHSAPETFKRRADSAEAKPEYGLRSTVGSVKDAIESALRSAGLLK